MPAHYLDRFSQNYIPEPNSGCWLWLGTINEDGYGRFTFNGRKLLAHRASLEFAGVVIDDGMQVDHLCRVRCCVNPEHLEPVTPLENTLRAIRFRTTPNKVHCAYGHELALVGSFSRKDRLTPACMECARISRRNYRETVRPARRPRPDPRISKTDESVTLPFQVECKSSQPFFETIAAFNHIKAACRYAQDCKKTNPRFEYRLRDIDNGKTYAISAYKRLVELTPSPN